MNIYSEGFEENDRLRSIFIRELTLQVIRESSTSDVDNQSVLTPIPKVIVRFWHDFDNIPDDVRLCLRSWEVLREEGFELKMFNDKTAMAYIREVYGKREAGAFMRCRHPAMRSDYFRMCYLLAEGGFYVDTDDVFLGDGWSELFQNDKLKVQLLCYDILTGAMLPAAEIWRLDLSTSGRIFYVNNDPIVAPAGHPLLKSALNRSTGRLLGNDIRPEIQSTTGPGNLTAVLAAHAQSLMLAGVPFDFEFLQNWDAIAETRWELSYRNDDRNWRNMDNY